MDPHAIDVGAGSTIALGHGLETDKRIFAAQCATFSDRYRVVAWDARGHGTRPRPDAPFSYADLADDLAGLLDDRGIERAIVGGVSQGAFVGLEFALRYPHRVAGLVLVSCQAGQEPPEVIPPQREAVHRWASHGLAPEFAQWMADMNFGPDFVGNREWVAYWMARDGGCYIEAFEALFARPDRKADLDKITAPAIVIRGEHDGWISSERAEELAAGLPGSGPVVTIAGAYHMPTLTHPEPTNRAIATFLDRVGAF